MIVILIILKVSLPPLMKTKCFCTYDDITIMHNCIQSSHHAQPIAFYFTELNCSFLHGYTAYR